MSQQYLTSTAMLDFNHPTIQSLIIGQGWLNLNEYERIGAAYNYVRDHIEFGYNQSDELSSSQVLADGYGQCNTKATLLMSLLRALGIACRFHGFTIEKQLQKGAITGIFYLMAPNNIIHSWVEVYYQNKWLNLEGIILDQKYLTQLQTKFSQVNGAFSGYGVGTKDFKNPPIDWLGNDTYIQKEGINNDLGRFNSPDDFYTKKRQQSFRHKEMVIRTFHPKIDEFKCFKYQSVMLKLVNDRYFTHQPTSLSMRVKTQVFAMLRSLYFRRKNRTDCRSSHAQPLHRLYIG